MEIDWDWRTKYFVGAIHESPAYPQRTLLDRCFCLVGNQKIKKEGIYYELWRIWGTICIIRIERKIK